MTRLRSARWSSARVAAFATGQDLENWVDAERQLRFERRRSAAGGGLKPADY
jgi:hypothetical protein